MRHLKRSFFKTLSALSLCLLFAASACTPASSGSSPDVTPEPPPDTSTDLPIEPEHVHAYGEWTVKRQPTCTEDGLEERVCDGCDTPESRPIQKLGHTFGDYTPNGDASCFEDGTKTAKCIRCEVTDTLPDEGSAIGHHAFSDAYSYDDTSHFFACSVCGERREVTDHTVVDDYTCSVCGWHADGTLSLTYESDGEDGYIVTGSPNKALTKLVIPDTHDGKPVTGVKTNAFRESADPHESFLREIVFGKNVETIGYCAFGYCTALKSVTIPDNVTTLGDYAFYGCTALTDVTIGNGEISVGDYAFYGCTALTDVTFGGGSVTIGDYAFQECGFETLDFGDCNFDIKEGGFFKCLSLTDVTFGNGNVSIGDYTFQDCEKLKTITIGDGDVVFGCEVDWNCNSLTDIVIGDGNVKFCNFALYASPKLTTLTIGNGEISVGDYAFYGCEKLKNLAIGPNISELGDEPFGGCPSLEYRKQDGVKYLGNDAHPHTVLVGAENKSIGSVAMDTDTKFVLEYAFSGCGQLRTVTFGEHLKKIFYRAFEACTSLQSVVLSDDLTEIEHSVFDGCSGLTSVTFGSGVQKIGEYAFDGCNAIETVNIPSLAQWVSIDFAAEQFIEGSNPLSAPNATLYAGGSAVTEAVIPDGVTKLGSLIFAGYDKLTSLQIGKDVTEIGEGVLMGCKNVTSLTVAAGNPKYEAKTNCVYDKTEMSAVLGCPNTVIPSEIKTIPANTFRGIPLSATFVIPDSVEEIGTRAFMSCGTFTDLTLGAGLKTVGSSAFFGATATYNVPVTYHIRDLAKWCMIDFADEGANPLRWESAHIYTAPHAGEKETSVGDNGNLLTIPDGVEEIKPYAFYNIATQELHLPASVTEIAPSAFGMNCNLSSYKIEGGNPVYEVRDCGVVDKTTSTLVLGKVPYGSVAIGEGVSKIGDYAFSGKIFTNVEIASSVTEIGAHAFESCRIQSLTLGGNVQKIGDWAFAKNETSGVGIGSVVIPGNVTHIGDYAFYQSGVTSLTLGEQVQHIGENAFALNQGLASVRIPASVMELGKSAFWDDPLTEAIFDDRNWTVKDYDGSDVTPNFDDAAAVAAALKDSSYTWTKNV